MATLEEQIAEGKAKLAQMQGVVAPPPAVTPEAANALLTVLLTQVKAVFNEVMTPEDKVFFEAHVKEGAMGIKPFLDSQSIRALATLSVETYRSFLRGEAK